MDENNYEKLAQEISLLFEKKFGGFSPEDFRKVSKILGSKIRKDNSDFVDFYEKFSDDERRDIEFMMGM